MNTKQDFIGKELTPEQRLKRVQNYIQMVTRAPHTSGTKVYVNQTITAVERLAKQTNQNSFNTKLVDRYLQSYRSVYKENKLLWFEFNRLGKEGFGGRANWMDISLFYLNLFNGSGDAVFEQNAKKLYAAIFSITRLVLRHRSKEHTQKKVRDFKVAATATKLAGDIHRECIDYIAELPSYSGAESTTEDSVVLHAFEQYMNQQVTHGPGLTEILIFRLVNKVWNAGLVEKYRQESGTEVWLPGGGPEEVLLELRTRMIELNLLARSLAP